MKTENFKADEYYNQGKLFRKQGNLNAAIENYQQALLLKPDYAQAYYDLGNIFLAQEKVELAIENYRYAVSIKADFADAYCNLGVALKEQDELDAAIESYRHAIAITPDDAELYSNLGEVFWKQDKFDVAIENYQKALSLNPNAAIVHNNLGAALKDQGKLDEAVESYQRALVLDPDYSDVYGNLGIVFQKQGKLDQAIESYQRALLFDPNYYDGYRNLGVAFQEQGKLEAAIDSFKKALLLNPDYVEAFDSLFHTQLRCCDWSTFIDSRAKIVNGVMSGEQDYNPFGFLAISSSAAEQQQCATSSAKKHPLSTTLISADQRYQHDKIRIAYISADFCEHPMSFLMTGLFEQHDRERFEIIAISLQPEQNSPSGRRVKAAFDQFIEVTHSRDYDCALLMSKLEIDIAVDLMGFTKNCRPGIFTYHSAPIQINYLGYPATMGANYIDYIFADPYLIPLEYQAYYTEKVIYLPDCFQANDDKRTISSRKPTRNEVGLPESDFVFCSFNNSYKITPIFFDVWMRLLKLTPDSVLWLVMDNQIVSNNLHNEAIKRGIDPNRLIFTNRLQYADHLARFQLADLFLDTLPFNAGTTASDALWAGVPVITCSGETFASRMAGSLLNAIGLPELITHTIEEYENLAFKLATTPELLAEIRNKLAQNRNTYPLFDTDRFRRHIEAAYITMWEKYQRGESPASFAVQPVE